MSESSIKTIGEIYANMASEMIKFAAKLTDGEYHLAYALLNTATERLRSRNHVNFSVAMVSDMQEAGKNEDTAEDDDQPSKSTDFKETNQ